MISHVALEKLPAAAYTVRVDGFDQELARWEGAARQHSPSHLTVLHL
jgi:hypothetical protein